MLVAQVSREEMQAMPVTAGVPSDPSEQDDLSAVLGYIGWGKLAVTRAKLANSAATRDFLEIGLSLLQDDLLGNTGPNFDESERLRLFESLSRERILKRAAERDVERRNLYSANMFRHRWDRKDRYSEDLISYLFRPGPQHQHMVEMEQGAAALVVEVSLKELVQQLAAAEVGSMLADPRITLQAIIQVALPNHPHVRAFAQEQYDTLMPMWAALYERVAAAYGLKLRPTYTWLDVATLFNAAVEGALARARVERAEPTLSGGTGVLAASILAMLPSILEGMPGDIDSLYAVNSWPGSVR
jgi:hypothetical protein